MGAGLFKKNAVFPSFGLHNDRKRIERRRRSNTDFHTAMKRCLSVKSFVLFSGLLFLWLAGKIDSINATAIYRPVRWLDSSSIYARVGLYIFFLYQPRRRRRWRRQVQEIIPFSIGMLGGETFHLSVVEEGERINNRPICFVIEEEETRSSALVGSWRAHLLVDCHILQHNTYIGEKKGDKFRSTCQSNRQSGSAAPKRQRYFCRSYSKACYDYLIDIPLPLTKAKLAERVRLIITRHKQYYDKSESAFVLPLETAFTLDTDGWMNSSFKSCPSCRLFIFFKTNFLCNKLVILLIKEEWRKKNKLRTEPNRKWVNISSSLTIKCVKGRQ